MSAVKAMLEHRYGSVSASWKAPNARTVKAAQEFLVAVHASFEESSEVERGDPAGHFVRMDLDGAELEEARRLSAVAAAENGVHVTWLDLGDDGGVFVFVS